MGAAWIGYYWILSVYTFKIYKSFGGKHVWK